MLRSVHRKTEQCSSAIICGCGSVYPLCNARDVHLISHLAEKYYDKSYILPSAILRPHHTSYRRRRGLCRQPHSFGSRTQICSWLRSGLGAFARMPDSRTRGNDPRAYHHHQGLWKKPPRLLWHLGADSQPSWRDGQNLLTAP